MNTVIRPISQKQDKKVRALTLDEQQAFTDYLLTKDIKQCKYKNVFLIQMYMGLRVGEALALTMNDVDLKNKKINIHRTLTTDENNETIMENKTKTYAGMRVVPIPEVIYPYVIEQMNIANTQYNNDEKKVHISEFFLSYLHPQYNLERYFFSFTILLISSENFPKITVTLPVA